MNSVILPWLVEVGIITYRDFKKGSPDNVGGLPLPADYFATFVIFGALSLFTGGAEKPATLAAWGYVIATFLNLFDPTLNKTSSGTQAAPNTASAGTPIPPATVARPPTASNIGG